MLVEPIIVNKNEKGNFLKLAF